MSITIDCGEGKHDLCTGTGRQSYLFPQEDCWPPDPPFFCGCECHHEGLTRRPMGFEGLAPIFGVPCVDPECPKRMPEEHPAWPG